MSSKKILAACLFVLFYITSIGSVRAFSPQPGTAQDPLITVSYLNSVLEPLLGRVMVLEEEVELLDTRSTSLEQTVEQAQQRIAELEELVEITDKLAASLESLEVQVMELKKLTAVVDTLTEALRDAEVRVAYLEEHGVVSDVQPDKDTAEIPKVPEPVVGIINASWVNIRSGPGLGFDVILLLSENIEVEVLDQSDKEWIMIKYNHSTGYVHAPLLRIL